jgi:hypothetical protein
VTWESSGCQGGVRVFGDQAAQDGFPEDPLAVELGDREVATILFAAGDVPRAQGG